MFFTAKPPRLRRRRVVFAAILGCCLCLVILSICYVFRAPLLTWVANAWIIQEPVTGADAIVVLGGGMDTRPFAAAKLYRSGLAPKVLYMKIKQAQAGQIMPAELTETELTRRLLLSNNIPESALEPLGEGQGVANTHDESLALRAWARRSGIKSVIIVTDWFHTRRARWVFRRELRDEPLQIQMAAAPAIDYGVTNWWLHEDGLVAFQNEILKSVYYWMKY